jgi:hypothetical protein
LTVPRNCFRGIFDFYILHAIETLNVISFTIWNSLEGRTEYPHCRGFLT